MVLLAVPLAAQPQPLSLRDAVETALHGHPSMAASSAQMKAADLRVKEAESGYLPRLSYTESYQRSDNPVFVFGSLLTQHQFGASNFNIDGLNQPDFLNNFQSQLVLDQSVYDGGRTRSEIRSAQLGREMAGDQDQQTRIRLTGGVVRAYYGALLAEQSRKVAEAAVRSAAADLQRAQAVQAAGMSTDADVLAIQVHLAAMREQEIRRRYDVQVAQAALNEALGLPLDTPHTLSTSLQPLPPATGALAELESKAAGRRPEARQAQAALGQAEARISVARSALLPQVGFRTVFEADRQRFVTRGGDNWMVAATLRWNLFDGFASRTRKQEADSMADRARAEQKQLDAAIRLDVRRAWLNRKSTDEQLTVASAAVAMAEENLRIVKNRYAGGLTTVTELLRSEAALVEAQFRNLAAVHDQRLAGVSLEEAAGTLSPDSEVLR